MMNANHKPPDKTNAFPCEWLGFSYAELNQRLREAAAQCAGEIHSIILKRRLEPPPRTERKEIRLQRCSASLCGDWRTTREGSTEVENPQKDSIHIEQGNIGKVVFIPTQSRKVNLENCSETELFSPHLWFRGRFFSDIIITFSPHEHLIQIGCCRRQSYYFCS